MLDLAYRELHDLARLRMARESEAHTLQATALVHEAWLKLGSHLGKLEDRTHFYAIASRAMRQVLTDHARERRREKRGGARLRVTLIDSLAESRETGFDLLDLEAALDRLADLHPRHAEVVQLRFLGGLSIAEVAGLLGVSQSTIESDWTTARTWLRRRLETTP